MAKYASARERLIAQGKLTAEDLQREIQEARTRIQAVKILRDFLKELNAKPLSFEVALGYRALAQLDHSPDSKGHYRNELFDRLSRRRQERNKISRPAQMPGTNQQNPTPKFT